MNETRIKTEIESKVHQWLNCSNTIIEIASSRWSIEREKTENERKALEKINACLTLLMRTDYIYIYIYILIDQKCGRS